MPLRASRSRTPASARRMTNAKAEREPHGATGFNGDMRFLLGFEDAGSGTSPGFYLKPGWSIGLSDFGVQFAEAVGLSKGHANGLD